MEVILCSKNLKNFIKEYEEQLLQKHFKEFLKNKSPDERLKKILSGISEEISWGVSEANPGICLFFGSISEGRSPTHRFFCIRMGANLKNTQARSLLYYQGDFSYMNSDIENRNMYSHVFQFSHSIESWYVQLNSECRDARLVWSSSSKVSSHRTYFVFMIAGPKGYPVFMSWSDNAENLVLQITLKTAFERFFLHPLEGYKHIT